ncbi:hypothetical protein E3N88_09964 [Mikania micrantha]|uniref:Uncharacterized protein n=1 Tax=Mikania micrantha TaxID=192012 RepID=A0A5N6P9I2_9ASTR|nr:hypothetical protein E3N88_09964 [Mikania micrantha]
MESCFFSIVLTGIVLIVEDTDFYFLFVALDYTHHDHATTNSETTAEVYAVTTTSAANDCSAAVLLRQFPLTGLGQDQLREAILLVFVNKQDLPNAMDVAEITDKLGLHTL